MRGMGLREAAGCLLITMALCALLFLPVLSRFGDVLLGREDVHFFIWLLWHDMNALESGSNPLFAQEIFYPYGASLAYTTIAPLLFLIYSALPGALGTFGRISAIQILSFLAAGLASFALAYRFSGSFSASMLSSLAYNFSAFHFEKMLSHLNYDLALAFLPLAFLAYFDLLERKKGAALMLALSLLLIGLSELTVVVMAGFIFFLDVFRRYMEISKKELVSPRNIAIIGALVILSLLAHELVVLYSGSHLVASLLSSGIFLSGIVALVLGLESFLKSERGSMYLSSLLVCALPLAPYALILAAQPSYEFFNSVLVNSFNSVDIRYLFFPSDYQLISRLGAFQGLPAATEKVSVFILPLLLLIVPFMKGAGKEERYLLWMGALCVLLSFPVLRIGEMALPTPFFSLQLFPFLSALRVPSRFMLFALLFLSVALGLAAKRALAGRSQALCILPGALLLMLQWPATGDLIIDKGIPGFYENLSLSSGNESVFLYPDFNYYELEKEAYYQTFHGKALSYGILSRAPTGGNPLYSFYAKSPVVQPFIVAGPEESAAFALEHGYDYIVVQKKRCREPCFYPVSEAMEEKELSGIRRGLEGEFGAPVYEDDDRVVYRNGG